MTAPAIHHVAGECQWCAGRGRICDHPCLACEGTGSDSNAWVSRIFGYEPKDFRVTPRSHRTLVDTEEGTREIDEEIEASMGGRGGEAVTRLSDEVSWTCGGCGARYTTARTDVGHCMPCKLRTHGLGKEQLQGEPEQAHDAGCPAIADDESDYEHLADAGICTCGVRALRAARGDDGKEPTK